MAELGFKIDDSQIKGLVAEGLLAQLTGPAREEILKNAVVHLLTPPPNTYGRPNPSPLQQAFDQAANTAMREVVLELVKADEPFMTKIRGLIGEAVAKAMDDNGALRFKVIEAVGAIVAENWSPPREY